MNRYFTRSFFRFFLGFVVILAIAFGVLIGASTQMPKSVDNVASPE